MDFVSLKRLRARHARLEQELASTQRAPFSDQGRIARLKKHKLALKDRIAALEAAAPADAMAAVRPSRASSALSV